MTIAHFGESIGGGAAHMSPGGMEKVARGLDVNVSDLGDGHTFDVEGVISLEPGGSTTPQLVRRTMAKPERVLYFDAASNKQQVQRAWRFRYTGGEVIPGGPCPVYDGTVTDGEGELKLSRPKQTRFVVHARQQGVHCVSTKAKEYKTTVQAMSEGDTFVIKTRVRRETKYVFENVTGKAERLFLNHQLGLPNAERITCPQAKGTASRRGTSRRFEVELPASPEPFVIVVNEIVITPAYMNMAQQGLDIGQWIAQYVFQSDDPGIWECDEMKMIRQALGT
jgi:hypothetical protein